ncbi:BrnT family toxin [Xanthobacter sp. V4C-4]|uniref:BrnT family toxin n=1 Tax=Xanthobacter cornucopiae TaxID=3119924 RepID=UPI003727D4C9
MGETDDLEWDDNKDVANREKHGLPLSISSRLFDGRPRLDRQSSKSPDPEMRFETLAAIGEDVLLCVWTWWKGRRRAISLRMAKRSERRAYQEAIGGS